MKWFKVNDCTIKSGDWQINEAKDGPPLPYTLWNLAQNEKAIFRKQPVTAVGFYATSELAKSAAAGRHAASLVEAAKSGTINQDQTFKRMAKYED